MLKVIWDYNGLEILHHPFSRSDAKPKPIAFSRAAETLLAFTLSSDWLIVGIFRFLRLANVNTLVHY